LVLKFRICFAIMAAGFLLIPGKHEDLFDFNGNAQIDTHFADGIAESFETKRFVRAPVADKNQFAAPQHHFVKRKVFEVTAIREIYVWMLVIGEAKCFGDDGARSQRGPGSVESILAGLTWIAQPPPHTEVEERQKKCYESRGIVSHVGTDGCAGY